MAQMWLGIRLVDTVLSCDVCNLVGAFNEAPVLLARIQDSGFVEAFLEAPPQLAHKNKKHEHVYLGLCRYDSRVRAGLPHAPSKIISSWDFLLGLAM